MLWPFHNMHNKLNSFHSTFPRLCLTWLYINQQQQPTFQAAHQWVRANLQRCPINVTRLRILPLFPGHPWPLGSRTYQKMFFIKLLFIKCIKKLPVYCRLVRFLKAIKCRQFWQKSTTWMRIVWSKISLAKSPLLH